MVLLLHAINGNDVIMRVVLSNLEGSLIVGRSCHFFSASKLSQRQDHDAALRERAVNYCSGASSDIYPAVNFNRGLGLWQISYL